MVFVRSNKGDLLVASRNVINAPLGIVLVSFATDVVVHSADQLRTHQLLLVVIWAALLLCICASFSNVYQHTYLQAACLAWLAHATIPCANMAA